MPRSSCRSSCRSGQSGPGARRSWRSCGGRGWHAARSATDSSRAPRRSPSRPRSCPPPRCSSWCCRYSFCSGGAVAAPQRACTSKVLPSGRVLLAQRRRGLQQSWRAPLPAPSVHQASLRGFDSSRLLTPVPAPRSASPKLGIGMHVSISPGPCQRRVYAADSHVLIRVMSTRLVQEVALDNSLHRSLPSAAHLTACTPAGIGGGAAGGRVGGPAAAAAPGGGGRRRRRLERLRSKHRHRRELRRPLRRRCGPCWRARWTALAGGVGRPPALSCPVYRLWHGPFLQSGIMFGGGVYI